MTNNYTTNFSIMKNKKVSLGDENPTKAPPTAVLSPDPELEPGAEDDIFEAESSTWDPRYCGF